MGQATVQVAVERLPHGRDLPLPRYMSAGASGMDLCAAVDGELTIAPGEVALVPTGFRLSIPQGYEAQVRPRSGLALNHRLVVLNSPGTIDSDYRGEVKVILANLGKEPFVIRRGERIAQMVIAPVARAVLVERRSLDDTARGAGGFGHSGR